MPMLGRCWVGTVANAHTLRAAAPRSARTLADAREDRQARHRRRVGNTSAPRPLTPLPCPAGLVSRTRLARARRSRRADAERARFLHPHNWARLDARRQSWHQDVEMRPACCSRRCFRRRCSRQHIFTDRPLAGPATSAAKRRCECGRSSNCCKPSGDISVD